MNVYQLLIDFFFHIWYDISVGCRMRHPFFGHTGFEVSIMKQDEKTPITWEAADPKPPVIQSGHLGQKKQQE